MAHSLHQTYGHIIFSTKMRMDSISPQWEGRMYSYMGGMVENLKGTLLAANRTQNHVHLLVRESKSVSDQEFIGKIKRDTSKFINTERLTSFRFEWQSGYAWFSVGARQLDAVTKYIHNQKEHHLQVSYEDELLKFLHAYQVPYDEKYLWND